MSSAFLYRTDAISGARIRTTASSPYQSFVTSQVFCFWNVRRFFDQRMYTICAGGTNSFSSQVIYSIVATTSGQLNSLYPGLIIALSNCAPYFKNLSVTSSTRLVQLFTSFSNSLFLLSDEGHPRLLFFMYVDCSSLLSYLLTTSRLEMFTSVILHRLSENPNLIHGILAAHKTFEDLGTFTLERGLRDIRRVQLAKEEQARKAAENQESKRKGRTMSRDDPPSAAAEEKKNLLPAGNDEGEPENDEEAVPSSLPSAGPTAITESIVSPTSESIPTSANIQTASIKAKGKMKERRSSSSLDPTGSLERIAAAGIGRNGFVPTREWVASWQQGYGCKLFECWVVSLIEKQGYLWTQ